MTDERANENEDSNKINELNSNNNISSSQMMIIDREEATEVQKNDQTSEQIQKDKENTEVLAYYVFKSVLLYHYNYFIEWCIIHNGKNVIAFSKKQETVSNYCDLIIYLYKFHNEKFLKIYKKMEEWIQYKKS